MPLWFRQQSKGKTEAKQQNREGQETKYFYKDCDFCFQWLFQQKRKFSMKYL